MTQRVVILPKDEEEIIQRLCGSDVYLPGGLKDLVERGFYPIVASNKGAELNGEGIVNMFVRSIADFTKQYRVEMMKYLLVLCIPKWIKGLLYAHDEVVITDATHHYETYKAAIDKRS